MKASALRRDLVEQLEEEAKNTDLLVIGASNQLRLSRMVYGSIPDLVVNRVSCPVLVMHKHHRLGFMARLRT